MYQCINCFNTTDCFLTKCDECGERCSIVFTHYSLAPKDKFTTSADIAGKKQTYYQIPGFEFLGNLVPREPVNICCYGPPGGGKSSFLLQFADAISTKASKTLYIADEETKFSATMKKKIQDFGINNKFLLIDDGIKKGDILKSFRESGAKNLVLDSVNSLGLLPSEGEPIKKAVPGFSCFVLQSTKDGKYRGTTKWIHNCAIEVRVKKGIARTGKNRYGMSQKKRIFTQSTNKSDDNALG